MTLQNSVNAKGIGKFAIITGSLKMPKYGIKVKTKHKQMVNHKSILIIFTFSTSSDKLIVFCVIMFHFSYYFVYHVANM